ncbi:MAG: hypothetical protein L6300_11025 [Syntrophaceae bacterium]|nr:hypothetical protein [Syntrophaceae bacterium]
MITSEEEAYVLTRAYVPEHIVSLMTLISKSDPFLIEDHLGFVKDKWLILVGYPLEAIFSGERCERILKQAVDTFRPECLWFIGPEIPSSLMDSCRERQTDQYYALDIEQAPIKPSLLRAANKASEKLIIERGRSISKEHQALISELMERETLPDRVRELYRAMPEYLGRSSSAWTIDARDLTGKLCAFSVIELGAKNFSAYILGSHSKRYYAPHASDLLFLEMINLTREHGKNTINLGLGVNEGIRRFKEKWGGKPFLKYELCERHYGAARKVSLIDALMGKLN